MVCSSPPKLSIESRDCSGRRNGCLVNRGLSKLTSCLAIRFHGERQRRRVSTRFSSASKSEKVSNEARCFCHRPPAQRRRKSFPPPQEARGPASRAIFKGRPEPALPACSGLRMDPFRWTHLILSPLLGPGRSAGFQVIIQTSDFVSPESRGWIRREDHGADKSLDPIDRPPPGNHPGIRSAAFMERGWAFRGYSREA